MVNVRPLHFAFVIWSPEVCHLLNRGVGLPSPLCLSSSYIWSLQLLVLALKQTGEKASHGKWGRAADWRNQWLLPWLLP